MRSDRRIVVEYVQHSEALMSPAGIHLLKLFAATSVYLLVEVIQEHQVLLFRVVGGIRVHDSRN